MSSTVLVGRRTIAAVHAFRVAISGVWGPAPSSRSSARRKPPSSTTAMLTFHLRCSASRRAASTIFRASTRERARLVRMAPPYLRPAPGGSACDRDVAPSRIARYRTACAGVTSGRPRPRVDRASRSRARNVSPHSYGGPMELSWVAGTGILAAAAVALGWVLGRARLAAALGEERASLQTSQQVLAERV